MTNPNGPYPGRQLFLGMTTKGRPAFAYLVTGRSPASRERKGTLVENGLIMGPIGNDPYDWLRHYTAIRYDNSVGLAVVSNGIQTEAIFETYRLLHHTGARPVGHYMETIMTGAGYEPDNLHTPRIAGLIMNSVGTDRPVYILGAITDAPPARTYELQPEPGTMTGISTYNGDLENPEAFEIRETLPVIRLTAETPEDIATYMYTISEATNKGDDIRVCAVGGVRSDDAHTWNLAVTNRH